MSINLKNFKLTDEQINEFVQMMVNNEKKKVLLVADNFNELSTKLVQHIEEKGYVDNEHLAYFPEEHEFTGEEFHAFFDVATDFLAEKIGENVDEDCYFENRLYWMQVGDKVLRFFIMWGQGTATQLSFEDEDIPSDKIGDMEDFRVWISEKQKTVKEEKK